MVGIVLADQIKNIFTKKVGNKKLLQRHLNILLKNKISQVAIVISEDTDVPDNYEKLYNEVNWGLVVNTNTNPIYTALNEVALKNESYLIFDCRKLYSENLIKKIINTRYKNCIGIKNNEYAGICKFEYNFDINLIQNQELTSIFKFNQIILNKYKVGVVSE